jgi:flagellar assembly protein FliH
MRNYSRFIPGEEIAAVEQWNFGAIDTAAQLLASQTKAREEAQDASQAEQQRLKSYQDGYAAGMAQGRALAQTELHLQMQDFLANQAQQNATQLTALFAATQAGVADAAQVMAQGVLALSCELARQVLRQELSVNPNVVLPVLREALDLLGAEHRSAVVRMSPTDFAVLQPLVQSEFSGMALTLRADASILPGGCLLESAGTVVDASLQNRWQRAIASLGLSSAWEEPSDNS